MEWDAVPSYIQDAVNVMAWGAAFMKSGNLRREGERNGLYGLFLNGTFRFT